MTSRQRSFSWKMEQKNKETGKWAEVYRIEGDRVEER